jgi:glutathione peroxidase
MSNFYDFEAENIKGDLIKMSNYKGNLILIVNTASHCGFTKQYAGLEKMYKSHKDKGLIILAFPCNQFAGQEPGDAAEIMSFCKLNYDISFPIFSKIKVNGKEAHPLFNYLKSELPDILGGRIKWNFTKFLINRSGLPLKRFAPTDTPETIEEYINANNL